MRMVYFTKLAYANLVKYTGFLYMEWKHSFNLKNELALTNQDKGGFI